MGREIDIIRIWKKLVRRSGSKMPRKNDLHYIYNSWCPEGTKDVNHLKQKRPVLKDILKQSVNGTLQMDGFPNTIVKRKEFKILWNEVHGDIDPVKEKDLIKWTKSNLNKTKDSMWNNVNSDTKGWLLTCYLRFRNLANSMKEVRQEMKDWMGQYRAELLELEEFLEANPNYAKERHREKIKIGRQRMDDASGIYDQIPKSVDEKRELLRAEVFDVLFDHKELKDVPAWADKIDKEYVEKSIGMMRKGIDLGVDDLIAKNDQILESLRKIFDGQFKEVETKISSLVKKLEG